MNACEFLQLSYKALLLKEILISLLNEVQELDIVGK